MNNFQFFSFLWTRYRPVFNGQNPQPLPIYLVSDDGTYLADDQGVLLVDDNTLPGQGDLYRYV